MISWQLPTQLYQSLHVKYEFTQQHENVGEKLARMKASFICYRQYANVFSDCFFSFTHTNLITPTLICRVKAVQPFALARIFYMIV